MVEERRIELRNFGVFEVKKRAARKARNPRTGDKVYVPEKYVVTFKPGKEMEERVREWSVKLPSEHGPQACTSPKPVTRPLNLANRLPKPLLRQQVIRRNTKQAESLP